MLSSLQKGTSSFEYPGSLFIFEILNDKNSFNYSDRLEYNSSYFILGDIGIIAHFADGGILEDYFGDGRYFNKYQNHKLHPVQFSELCGIILYQQYRLGNYKPFYYYSVNMDYKKVTSIFCFNSSYVPFLKWDIKIYAECVYSFVKYYHQELTSPDELVHDDIYLTYLKDHE